MHANLSNSLRIPLVRCRNTLFVMDQTAIVPNIRVDTFSLSE